MAAFNYAQIRDKTVIPLLKRFGKITPAVLLFPGTQTGPDYNPEPGADVEVNATVVQTSWKKNEIDGKSIQKDDVKYLVSPEDLTQDPELAAQINVGGIIYQIMNVDPLSPGSTIMLWTVQGRK